MEQILKWLIDSSIIAGFIILIILAFRPLLKKLPKWVNLVLWLIVAVRLVMPVGLESNFSLVPDIGGLQAEYSNCIRSIFLTINIKCVQNTIVTFFAAALVFT